MRTGVLCAFLALAASGCEKSSAQIATDAYGPVRCYQLAWGKGLDEDHAIQLCQGALNAVPGQCYAQAVDEFHALSTQQLMTLCAGTTTLEPLACYGRLDAIGTMTEDQMINYCATTCALGPPPAQTSSAQCQAVALERASLPHQTAQQLCQGARSVGPALCFISGRAMHTISDSKLVSLCAEYTRCQYVNVVPPTP